MLKTIRVILAVLSLLAVTLLFVDFTGTAASLWPWMAKIQFMPAILSANIVIIAAIVIGTLIFGRLYCSVVCPLGIFQDVVNWLRGHIGNKRSRKNRFSYKPARTKLRVIVLTVFVGLLILGLASALATSIAGLIEPYSAYGRIASQIFAPIVIWINNLLAGWSESQVDNYDFYRVAMVVMVPMLIVAIITLVAIVVFAWRGGRDYCNTICPVGTMLGYLAKFSLLKPIINVDKCINCGKCGRNCKAKCIDTRNHKIDYTRCVDCMDCIGVCSEGAITYTWRASKAGLSGAESKTSGASNSRRGFIVATGLLAASAAAQAAQKTTDGGLTIIKQKKTAPRSKRLVPAGARSLANVTAHCTACQLCIQACPSHVLKPTLSLDGFMQPQLDFTQGWCQPYCTACTQACPAGALLPLTEQGKSSVKIGQAVIDLDTCISASEGKRCGSCAKHCPTGAIRMIPRQENAAVYMPVVDENLCIGCGSCEYHCPAGTVITLNSESSAIHVEGIDVHREI